MTDSTPQTFYTPKSDLHGLSGPVVDPGLPNVLLIGDSISIGYTPFVRQCLLGRANVLRPPVNCGDTRAGLAQLEDWLRPAKWAVIHFNWGLHDLCYRHPEATVYGHRDKIRGVISVPLEEYRSNLQALVRRLKETGASLIWASTTVVPDGEAGRLVGDEVRYNAVASEIMAAHNIPIDDLYAVTAGFGTSRFTCPGDVHFTAEGYELLGRRVAENVVAALGGRGQCKPRAPAGQE